MVEEYSLADIKYDKWDKVLDDFNSAKYKFPNLKFETWYHQQKHWLLQKEEALKDINNHDDDHDHPQIINLLDLIHYLFGAKHINIIHKNDLDLEEYEWDPWDEDEDLMYGEDEDELNSPYE